MVMFVRVLVRPPSPMYRLDSLPTPRTRGAISGGGALTTTQQQRRSESVLVQVIVIATATATATVTLPHRVVPSARCHPQMKSCSRRVVGGGWVCEHVRDRVANGPARSMCWPRVWRRAACKMKPPVAPPWMPATVLTPLIRAFAPLYHCLLCAWPGLNVVCAAIWSLTLAED